MAFGRSSRYARVADWAAGCSTPEAGVVEMDDGIRFMHRLLESLDGFSESFSQLRQFAGAKNNQHDEED
jgi:hypothetical protein